LPTALQTTHSPDEKTSALPKRPIIRRLIIKMSNVIWAGLWHNYIVAWHKKKKKKIPHIHCEGAHPLDGTLAGEGEA